MTSDPPAGRVNPPHHAAGRATPTPESPAGRIEPAQGSPGETTAPAGGTTVVVIGDHGTAISCHRCGAYRPGDAECPRCKR